MQIHIQMNPNGNQNIQNSQILPGSNTNEGQENLLLQVLKGSVFQGEILNIQGQEAQIRIGQYILNARMEHDIPINIGEHLNFLVKENNGGKIVLKPVAEQTDIRNQIIIKTLEEASLPVTERTMAAVKEMMSLGMPVDKQSMAEMGKILHQFPEAPVEILVSLKHMGMPVTEGNISQFQLYQNNQGNLMDAMGQMMKEMFQMVEQARTPEQFQRLQTIVGQLKQVIAGGNMAEVPVITGQSESLASEHQRITIAEQPKQNVETVMNQPQVLSEGKTEHTLLSSAKIPGEQVEQMGEQVLLKSEELIRQSLKSDIHMLGQSLKNNLLITPEQLAAQGEKAIQKAYEQLEKTTGKLMEILQSAGEEHSKLMSSAGDLKNNMNFMSDLNEMAAYVQIPVKLGQREQTGELYVLSRRKRNQEKDGPKTAVLHLDMEHLGATDVRVSMEKSRVSTKFTLDNDASYRLVKEHLPELQERLEKLGYTVELTAEETEQKTIPFQQIIEAERPKKEIKRYSFDVRA